MIGIKDGKIWDIVSNLRYKRDDSISDKEYLDLPMGDWVIGDTWDFEKNISLKNSPKRFIEKPKSELELLQEKYNELELRIKKIEEKK